MSPLSHEQDLPGVPADDTVFDNIKIIVKSITSCQIESTGIFSSSQTALIETTVH